MTSLIDCDTRRLSSQIVCPSRLYYLKRGRGSPVQNPKGGAGWLPKIQKGERGAPQDPQRGMKKRVNRAEEVERGAVDEELHLEDEQLVAVPRRRPLAQHLADLAPLHGRREREERRRVGPLERRVDGSRAHSTPVLRVRVLRRRPHWSGCMGWDRRSKGGQAPLGDPSRYQHVHQR